MLEMDPPFKKPKGVRLPLHTKDGRKLVMRKTYLGVMAYLDGIQVGYMEIDCTWNHGYENRFWVRKVWVEVLYRNLGIATAMYDFAVRAGFRPLAQSKTLTDDGQAFWKNHIAKKERLGISRDYHSDYPNRFYWRPLYGNVK